MFLMKVLVVVCFVAAIALWVCVVAWLWSDWRL